MDKIRMYIKANYISTQISFSSLVNNIGKGFYQIKQAKVLQAQSQQKLGYARTIGYDPLVNGKWGGNTVDEQIKSYDPYKIELYYAIDFEYGEYDY